MLTFFTIPKPFRGHIAVIQKNAIHSWTLLRPGCEIILFGDDEGTAEVATEFRARHVAEVARNEYGTPLINDLFEKAQRMARHDLLCYVNSDIILMSDFIQAVERVARYKRNFLMVGQRWDVEVKQPFDFGPHWEEDIRVYVARYGQIHPPSGIDFFVFPRGLWSQIPPFAIGRTVWDNWLIYKARALGAAVVDVTKAVMVVHQNHDYSHAPGGEKWVWEGDEAKRNLELAGGYDYVFTLEDATHILTPSGIKLNLNGQRIWRHLATSLVLLPYLRPVAAVHKIFARTLKLLGQNR